MANPDLSSRHESTRHLMKWLVPNQNLTGTAAAVAHLFHQTGLNLIALVEDGPELSVALRHLQDGKNCGVIQALEDSGVRS